jgi:hypothetical protein
MITLKLTLQDDEGRALSGLALIPEDVWSDLAVRSILLDTQGQALVKALVRNWDDEKWQASNTGCEVVDARFGPTNID